MVSGQHGEEKRMSWIRSIVSLVLMVAAVAIITVMLRMFVFVPYEIPTGSMEETIMAGDMVFSEKITYYTRQPERGDIVTFADPEVAGRTRPTARPSPAVFRSFASSSKVPGAV